MDVLSVCVDAYMLQDFMFVVFRTAHFRDRTVMFPEHY